MAHQFILQAIATILVTLLFLSSPTTAGSPVLDIDGNPLEVGSQYYVLTTGRGAAGRGGLTDTFKPPSVCPSYVAQHGSWTNNGRPVTFYPSDSSQKQIIQGDEMNIAFGIIPLCRSTGIWRLTFDNETHVPYVATNGVIGNPGTFETFGNWFKIEKAFGDSSYKIVFCFVEPVPAPGNTNLVGRRRHCEQLDATQKGPNGDLSYLSLVPLDQNLPFFGYVFKKVDTSSATTTTAFY